MAQRLRRRPDIKTTVDQRLRRRPNIKPILDQRPVFFWGGGGGCINTLDAPQHQHSIYISAHLIVRRRSLVIAGLGFEAGVCAQVVLAFHHADLIRQPNLRERSPVHVVFPRHPGMMMGGLLQSLDPSRMTIVLQSVDRC